MAPLVLDYDGDGNVIGGHTVDELPDNRSSTQMRAPMKPLDSKPRSFPDRGVLGPDPAVQHYQQYEQLRAQPPSTAMYHQHSLPSGIRDAGRDRRQSVQPPYNTDNPQRPGMPPRFPQGPTKPLSYTSQREDLPPLAPPEFNSCSGYGLAPRHGFVVDQNHLDVFTGQSRSPSLVQKHFEPAGYRRSSESFADAQQQSLAPQFYNHVLPPQDFRPSYQPPPQFQQRGSSPYRAHCQSAPVIHSQQALYQQQYQTQQHGDRYASSICSRSSIQHHTATPLYASPYDAMPNWHAPGDHGGSPHIAPSQPTRVKAGHDEMSTTRTGSSEGLPTVEDVLLSPTGLNVSPIADAPGGEVPSVVHAKLKGKARAETKHADETTATVVKNATKQTVKKDAARNGKKKGQANLLGRCKDCKKRHKKCEHLPASAAGASTVSNLSAARHDVATSARMDARDPASLAAAEAQDSDVPPDEETQGEVYDADDGLRGTLSPPRGEGHDQEAANVDAETSELRFEDFLRSDGPEHDQGSPASVAADETTPAVNAASFLNKLHAQIQDTDHSSIEAFYQEASRYKAGALSETEFYTRVYKLFRDADALNLLPDFAKCLPHHWDPKQESLLNEQVELDVAEQTGLLAGNIQILPKDAALESMRKRRPKVAFRASDSLEVLGSTHEDIKTVSDHGKSLASFVRATPPRSPKSSVYAKLPEEPPRQIDEDDVLLTEAEAKREVTKLKRGSRAKKDSRRTSSTTRTIKRSIRTKKVQYGHLPASEVEHVGPVYADRRKVLRRGNNPYVHHICGQGFPHPQEVRAHHNAKKCHDGSTGQTWDEHPSCKADYPELNYTKVWDGYVILDQASWDKLQNAIAAGEKVTGRRRRDTKELERDEISDIGDGDDSEDDAEHELDDEFEDCRTATSTALPQQRCARGTTLAEVTSASVVNPRKRAASKPGGRATKRVTVKAGSDEAAVRDAAGFAASGSSLKTMATEKAVGKQYSGAADAARPASLMARAAALGLRTRT